MGQASDFDRRIADLIEPTVESMGFELVRVRVMGAKRVTLQVMAERPDGTMSVDNCAALSRALSAFLDVEDPIVGEYVLEVSSPGLDRPLTRLKDFDAWAGFDAKVELKVPRDGRKRFTGRLKGLEDQTVLIETKDAGGQDEITPIPFESIADAKLIITDELIAKTAHRQNADELSGSDPADVEDSNNQ